MAVVWRHRNKLLFLLALAGAGYVGSKYLRKKLKQFQDKEMTIQLENVRFNEHFLGNYKTAVTAVTELLPTLKEAIQTELNAEAITDQLKLKPANKRDLWDNLKIISFTRLVGGAYAYALLSVFMRIQMSILGGRIFKNLNKAQGEGSVGGVAATVQKEYLSTVQHLLKEGLHSLVVSVRGASELILGQYSLKQQLSCEGVLQLVQDIRHQAAVPAGHARQHSAISQRRRQHFLLQYAMPKETLLQQPEVECVGEKALLLLGTRDLVESMEVGEVMEGCVEEVFNQTLLHIRQSFTDASQQSDQELPLARVIPLVCDTSLVLFTHPQQSTPVQGLLSSKDLQTLSRNIYEAFAHDTIQL